MKEYLFYKLLMPLEKIVPSLVEKAFATRRKCALYVDKKDCAYWDSKLWNYSTNSFLPHAHIYQDLSAENLAMQHILITDKMSDCQKSFPNNASIVFNLSDKFIENSISLERIIEFSVLFPNSDSSGFSLATERLSFYQKFGSFKGTLCTQNSDGSWKRLELNSINNKLAS